MDVKKKALTVCTDKGILDEFEGRWRRVMSALTYEKFTKVVEIIETKYRGRWVSVVNYLHHTWLDPHRTKFVSFWTKEIKHYGGRTNNM